MDQSEAAKKIEAVMPAFVSRVTSTLTEAGFEAYVVGGSVRDALRGVTPKDWDVATNALPEQVEALFDDTYKENDLGTVGVKVSRETAASVTRGTASENATEKDIVEVTTYRSEGAYSDKRRPDTVTFVTSIEEDLSRRDFTINAIAYNPVTREIVDPFKGVEDVSRETITCVGEAEERFQEDALRMLRAVRFQTQLKFIVSRETFEAIITNHQLLEEISQERIRDEFSKIVLSDIPAEGLFLLDRTRLLEHIVPELLITQGVEQKGAHKYDVWTHLILSLQHAADKKWSLEVRLAALFHDIAKPQTRGKGRHKEYSFYGHEVEGAKMAKEILERLKFPKRTVLKVTTLIRHHMFLSDPDAIGHSAIRRLLQRVGQENLQDLLALRMADRIGAGRPVEEPYRLRKFQAMIDEVMTDPVTVGMLALKGDELMKELSERPSPRIGFILHALLQEVLEDPVKNKKEILLPIARELAKLSNEELRKKGEEAKEVKKEEQEKKVEAIYKKRGTRKES